MTIAEKINEVIDSKISPVLQTHGGDVTFEKYDEETGILYVTLTGACGSCPFAKETLRMTVEGVIVNEIPEVKEVRQL